MNAHGFLRPTAEWRDLSWRMALVALAYVVLGKLGLGLTLPEGFAALMWPPAGIAMGALLLYGRMLWPGVFLGALILQLMVAGAFSSATPLSPAQMLVPMLIAGGATLQAVSARVLIMRLMGSHLALSGWHDALKLLLIAGPLSCLISASCAVTALAGFGQIGPQQVFQQWRDWWFGDVFGVLVFLPLMIIAPHVRTTLHWRGTPIATLSRVGLLTLLVPLAITLYAWRASGRFLHERATSNFAALASENELALQFRIQSYEQALRAGAGFVVGKQSLSRTQWRAFTASLDLPRRYPGMHGMGWIAAVLPEELPAYVAAIRRTQNASFAVKPEGSHELAFIITYVEPEAHNAPAIGLNIAFERFRREAALSSRASGQPTLTHKLQLVQDNLSRPGFLLLLPVFATPGGEVAAGSTDTFLGWVYAPLVGENLIAALTNAQGQLFSLRVYDGNDAADQLIYSSAATAASSARYQLSKTIRVGQQRWQLQWQSTKRFEQGLTSLEPALILIVGLLSTTLFAAFLLTSRQRERAFAGLVHDQSLQLQESQLALHTSEATLRAAMEHAPIGMALVATSGRWLQANRACCEMLGYSLAELQGMDFQAITHPDDLAEGLDLQQQLLAGTGHSYQLEKRYLHKDGHYVWGLLAVAPVRDVQGTPQYLIAQILDITQRREVDRIKSEFISTVSHELRTPLTSIRGALGLLDSGRLGSIPTKASQMVRIAHTNCERLIRIINDILDIEKFESGRLALSMIPISLANLLRQSIDANLAYAQKYSVELLLGAVPEDLLVHADPDRLMQVMANLLSNAAKFSPAGAQVAVRVSATVDTVIIEVQDFGAGIPDAFQARIFEKFVQAESSAARRFDGTGLGLAITKQLLQAMDGSISFTSKAGYGTTFRVQLKRAGWPEGQEHADPAHLQTFPHLDAHSVPKILHVEDDQDLSRVIQVALAGRADLVRVATLSEARRQLRQGKYALLLIDLFLPDGDGAELVEEYSGQLPTIVLSVAEAPPQIRAKARVCLIKSKTAESLIIEHLLEAVQASQESTAASAQPSTS